jgi:hypothetical protein
MPLSRKKSCMRCRQSKLRCNQANPSCSRCSERGIRCVYDWRIGEAGPYANLTASRLSRTPSMSATINGEPINAAQSEDLANISSLSTSTFMNHQFQDTDISLDDFQLNLTSMNAYAEQSFGTANLDSLLGATNGSSAYSSRTDIQEYPEIEAAESGVEVLERMAGDLDNSGQWPLGKTISPNHTSHLPQTMPVQLPPRRGTFQRRNVIRHCLSSSIVLGQLTNFSKMMIQGDRLPPFICPPCQLHEEMVFDCARSRKHQCLPKNLAICAGLVHMYFSRTPQNADFVWKTIYAEKDRLHREVRVTKVQGVQTED